MNSEHPLEAHLPTNFSKCRSCQASIVWMKTARGANMPVDADSVDEGDDLFDHTRHVSHFATCPNAAQHRKREYGRP